MGETVKVNFSNVKTYEPPVDGVYTVQIAAVTLKTASTGTQGINFESRVVEAKDSTMIGKPIYWTCWINEESEKNWFLFNCCEAAGVSVDKTELDLDTEEFVGVTLKVQVATKDGDNGPRSEVKKFFKVD